MVQIRFIGTFLCLLVATAFAQQPAATYTEAQKINHLIAFVEHLKGATFIRNGESYTPKQAADHLSMKRNKAGNRIKTAKEFIDKIATASSLTGEPYLIQFANGKAFPTQLVLMSELKKLEEGKVQLLMLTDSNK
ncbi:MAG: DUF5329 domain-containing protein [Bacteroidia bacterium]|jgi:hypothetical protein|nr:DUF5329 domain-containing protein [Bacteroidia bacterium]